MIARKIVSIAATVLALSLALTGCGGKQAPAADNTQTQAPGASKIAYPEREITLIIPWAAGGGTDLIGRKLAALIEKDLGRPIVVVNKTGGGGLVGFQEVAKAKPDGYTLGFISNSMLLQKYSNVSYADYKNFEPIALVNEDPASLTVKNDSPYKTLQEFLAAAKQDPGKVSISNSGPGAIWHVSALNLEKKTGVKFKHVPYEGANPAAVAVAGGHAVATTASAAEMLSLVDGKELRVLGVASEKRLDHFPDVPTFKEQGVDMVFGVWRGFVAPKGTPDEIVQMISKALEKAVASDDYKAFMAKGSFGIKYAGGADFGKYMDGEDAQYADLFKGLDIKKK